MRKLIFFVLVLFFNNHFLFSQKIQFQQKVDQYISVNLNTEMKTLSGKSKVKYYNNSPMDLHEIYFYLYINNYQSNNSTLSKQLLKNNNVNLYFANVNEIGGYTQIDFLYNRIKMNWSYENLDKTIVKISLKTPLKSGDFILIDIPFNIKLPKYIYDVGYSDSQFIFSNWYPQIIHFDNRGWNINKEIPESLLQSEFGNYEVKIRIPDNYIIAASGSLVNRNKTETITKTKTGSPDSLTNKIKYNTLEYHAENLNKFTWYASDSYSVYHDTISTANNKDLNLFIYYKDISAKTKNKLIQNARDEIKYYSDKLGEYPFPKISIVINQDIKKHENAAMLKSLTPHINGKKAYENNHLLGLMWFNSYFSINKELYPWMIDGFSSYYIDFNSIFYTGSMFSNDNYPLLPATLTFSDYESPRQLVAFNQKTALSFIYLKNYLGEDIFDRIIREYFKKWKFKSPTPKDLSNHFKEQTGEDFEWFFHGMLAEANPITYCIQNVKKTKKGYTVTIENTGKYKIPFDLGDKDNNIPVKGFTGTKEITLDFPDLKYVKIDPKYSYYKNRSLKQKENIKKTISLPKYSILGLNGKGKSGLILPVLDYNANNGLMAGILFSNKTNILSHFVPMYSFKTKSIVGGFKIDASLLPSKKFKLINVGIEGKSFHRLIDKERDFQLRYTRLTIFATTKWGKGTKYHKNSFKYKFSVIKDETLTNEGVKSFFRYINNYTFTKRGGNIITPYKVKLILEHQYFNYHINRHYLSIATEINTSYMYKENRSIYLRIYGSTYLFNNNTNSTGSMPGTLSLIGYGVNDYTYEKYFFNRSAQDGFWSRQIMMNTGGFKNAVGNQYGIGQSNKYIGSANIRFDLPMKIFIKPYFDFGIYGYLPTISEGYTDKIVYSSGFVFEIVKDKFEIYLPLLNSKEIESIYKEKNGFWNRFSFMLDINI